MTWFCIQCGAKNETNFCTKCGTSKPQPVSKEFTTSTFRSNEWVCDVCGERNIKTFCILCGTPVEKAVKNRPEITTPSGKSLQYSTSIESSVTSKLAPRNSSRKIDDFLEILKEKFSMDCVYHFNQSEKAKTKFKAAMESYGARIPPNEQPIICYDATLFGGAEDGCIFTTKGIYSHKMFEDDVKFIQYDEIIDVSIAKNEIKLNGNIGIDASLLNDEKKKTFCNLIKYIQADIPKYVK